jgi:hypothetical protein
MRVTPGGIAVQAVDGAEARRSDVISQAGLGAFGSAGEEAGGLVGDNVEGVLPEDADFGRGTGRRRGRHFHGVSRPEPVVGHPDAPAVHEDAALVQDFLRLAARDGEASREKRFQGQARIRPVHDPTIFFHGRASLPGMLVL